jgi:hypothetical protein
LGVTSEYGRYVKPLRGPQRVSLARSIGDAIHHAYQGELDYRYPEGSGVLRVHWRR